MTKKKIDPDAPGPGWLMPAVVDTLHEMGFVSLAVDLGDHPAGTYYRKPILEKHISHKNPPAGKFYQVFADGMHLSKAYLSPKHGWMAIKTPAMGELEAITTDPEGNIWVRINVTEYKPI